MGCDVASHPIHPSGAKLMNFVKLVVLVCLSGVLSGCVERWQKVEQIGGFEKTEYWHSNKLDWEGNSTGVYKNRLCLLATGQCIEDDYVHIKASPGRVVEIPGWLNDEQQLATDTMLFDKQSGEPLRCVNCDRISDVYGRLDRLQLFWSASGEQAFVTNGDLTYLDLERDNQKHYELWLLQIMDDGFEVTELLTDRAQYPFGFLRGIRYSPNQQQLAWHLCTSGCSLWWYDIAENSYGSQAIPEQCEYNSYWQIGWQNGLPRSEYYWGATQAHICLTGDGQPLFPVQSNQ